MKEALKEVLRFGVQDFQKSQDEEDIASISENQLMEQVEQLEKSE